MVYGTERAILTGVYKEQLITGGGTFVGKSTINGVFSIAMWKIVKVPEGIAGCIQTSIREYGYESKLKTQKNPRILVDV